MLTASSVSTATCVLILAILVYLDLILKLCYCEVLGF